MDPFEKGLEASREAANLCAEVARGEHGTLGGEALVTEAGRAEAALRAAVKDLGVGERMALSPAISACETLLVAIEDHEDEAAKRLAERVRAAEAALREVMALPGEEGPDDPGDNEHGRAHH
ncbi:hypothetical protein EON77_05365 [bacterium]|nr:MAG: hypothetical protein EON77_05365 [bacterium]